MRFRGYPRELVVIALAGFAALSLLYGPNWSDGSRLALTQAVALQGTIRTDAFQTRFSGDAAFYGGHYYTDKAPGLSFAALPAFEALRAAGAIGPQARTNGVFGQRSLPLWFLRVSTSGLFFLLALLLVGRAGESIAAGTGAATAVAFGLGTMALPLTPIIFSHTPAGALGLGAFLLAWWAADARRRNLWPWLAAGASAGAAVTMEYQSGLIAVAVFAYVAWRTRAARPLLAFAAGALPWLVALGAYNRAAFGSPFHLSYRYVESIYTAQQRSGFFGVGRPSAHGLAHVLVQHRGLLLVSPVLAAAAAGLVLLWLRGLRAEAAVCGFVTLAFLVYDVGYFDPYGGYSPGPRYFAPALPFLALGLPEAFRRWPRATSLLAAVSVVVNVWIAFVWPMRDDFLTVWARAGIPKGVGAVAVALAAAGAFLVATARLRLTSATGLPTLRSMTPVRSGWWSWRAERGGSLRRD